MIFSVSYRGKNGSLREEQIEAATRGECFAKCKALGISPVSVRTSKCGARKKKDTSGKSNMVRPILIVGAIAVLTGGIWNFSGNKTAKETADAKPVQHKRKMTVKESIPAKAPEPISIAVPKKKDVPVKKQMTIEEREAMIEKRIMEMPLDFTAKTNRAFSTGLEQKLAAIFMTELGAPPPLMPLNMSPVTYLRLEEILNAPNEILETDSDRVAEAKQVCAEAKKMMKEHMAAGGDPEKFLESYYSLLKQASEEWKTAQMTLVETMRTDPGLAATMEAEINENFAARGIRPVKMPPKMKERYGIK